MKKNLAIPVVAFLCIFFYYLPWIFMQYKDALLVRLLFVMSMLWAILSWILMIIFIVLLMIGVFRHKNIDIYRVISIISMSCFYIAWFVGIFHGFTIRV